MIVEIMHFECEKPSVLDELDGVIIPIHPVYYPYYFPVGEIG